MVILWSCQPLIGNSSDRVEHRMVLYIYRSTTVKGLFLESCQGRAHWPSVLDTPDVPELNVETLRGATLTALRAVRDENNRPC